MDLPLTVVDSSGSDRRDVVVRCDPSTLVGELASSLSAVMLAGTGPSSPSPAPPLYRGDRPLARDEPVGGAGLLAGDVVTLGPPVADHRRAPSGRYQLAVVGGMSAGSVVGLPEGVLTIGRSAQCDFPLDDAEVSRLHASITVSGGTVTVEDMHSVNGTTLNGVAIQGPVTVAPGDEVAVGNSILTVRLPPGPPGECEALGDGRLRFNKPPRQRRPAEAVNFQLPEEPSPPVGRHFSVMAMLAPLGLGLVFVVLTRQLTFLVFSLASPLMLGANVASDRRTGRRTFAQRLAEYEKAKATLSDRLEVAIKQEEKDRRSASADPAMIASIADGPTQQLWERRREDGDFLFMRIGRANLPSEIKLVTGRESPAVEQPVVRGVPVTVSLLDSGVVGLAGPRPSALRSIRSMMLHLATLHSPHDVSFVLLSAADPDGWDWLKWLPHVAPSGSAVARPVATEPEQRRRLIDELVALVESRRREQARRYEGQQRAWPATVLILDDVTKLRAEQGVAYLLREGPAVGIVGLCYASEPSGLPAEAQVSIEFQTSPEGFEVLQLTTGGGSVQGILPDGVDEAVAGRVSRALAPMYEVAARAAGSAGLPSPPVSHLDLLGREPPTADSVLARWAATAGGGHTPALVGVIEDGPFTVDLRRDGPHLLIAGTTGAGKSELLQTLVASLALVNRPDDLTFLLVDFKGGSAFKDCALLPHTMGVISNLDGGLVERALDSLAAELRWRQARFNETGHKDYDDHAGARPRRGPPMPRLVVVVDELKELSDAYSDAVPRLNQAARLGRSLGVHLVLATQKPALVPGLADLRANTDLRLCLRVQDEADSREVVGVPDAASIRRVDVGRGIARQSDGSQITFQTGYLGGPVPPAGARSASRIEVRPFDLTTWGTGGSGTTVRAGTPAPAPAGHEDLDAGPTALQVLVEAISAAAERLELAPQRVPWWPPLPFTITLDDLRLSGATPRPPTGLPNAAIVPIALMDLPDEQRQEPLLLDFDDLAHLLVIGPTRSGRTTFLRSLAGSVAKRASPADVHVYCLEFRRPSLGDLERLPHCGAVVGVDDVERLERFFLFLETEVERRALAMSGCSSLAEQRARAKQSGVPGSGDLPGRGDLPGSSDLPGSGGFPGRSGLSGGGGLPGSSQALPYVVVLCDNYEAFHERFSYEDGGRLVDRFAALLSDGPGRGIHFVITSDRRGLATKLGTSIEARFVLRPSDRDDQLAIGLRARTVPLELPPGRGYWYRGPAQAQVALVATGDTGESQVAAIGELGRRAASEADGLDRRLLPRPVPPLPDRVTAAEVEARRALPRPVGRAVVTLGVGGIDVSPLDVDLDAAGSTFVVAGPRGSGRSTALLALVRSLLTNTQPMTVCVVAPRRSPLRDLTGTLGVHLLTSLDSIAGDLADTLASVSGPLALVIDDAELLLETPASARLDRWVRAAGDNDWLVVLAGTTSDLTRRFSGWVFEARQSRSGILLQPSSAADGEIFDLRLPRSTGSVPRAAGHGILALRGRWMTLQVLTP